MSTATEKIKQTVTFKMVNEEARELSWKYCNKMYVILRNNSLITSMSKDDGEVLSAWSFGNQLIK
jgi:hypothetical protein